MPLDSQEKRMAAAGVARPYMRATFPVATPDEEWRISVGLAYGGNALTLTATTGQLLQIPHHFRGGFNPGGFAK